MAMKRNVTLSDPRLACALAGEGFLLMDGGMGTLIQREGLHGIHEVPDLLNLTHPDAIVAIQRRYAQAGADCLTTNTFSANRLKLAGTGATVAEVYAAAAANARAAGAASDARAAAPLVAGDIGPTGALLEPLGALTFEEAYDIFAEQARAAADAGCNLILVETMADLLEAKAAVLAAVEQTSLPVFATMTFGEDGRTFLGTTPAIAASALSALGAAAVGVNCSLGPDEMAEAVRELAPFARGAVMAQPNAGLPRLVDGETRFDVGPKAFAKSMEAILDAGATIVGGCCGTGPEHIAALRALVDARTPAPCRRQRGFTVAGAQQMTNLPEGARAVAVIGERINPTGKKKLRTALESGDMDYLVGEAAAQQRAGADILDVNVGVPGLDEPAVLARVVRALQATVPVPLQLDSSDPAAIEAAARIYAGRPLVNSVNGKAENLEAVLPIVAHYGCTVVGLTLDEDGIPPTAEGRLAIAERIVAAAEAHGVLREDVAIDCLVMAAATNQAEISEVLRAVALVKERLGVRTVLGVSNVSFGMPARPLVNATFLAAAFGAGLDMPILNPLNDRYRDTVAVFRMLNGQDEGCRAFIEDYGGAADPYDVAKGYATAPDALHGQGPAAPASGSCPSAAGGSAAMVTPSGSASPSARADAPACAYGALASGLPGSPAPSPCPIPVSVAFADAPDAVAALAGYVLEGRGVPVASLTEQLLETHDGLAVINDIFVPILDEVGRKYDSGAFFLPQLMASAEAVKAGFDVVRSHMQPAVGYASSNGEPDGAGESGASDGAVKPYGSGVPEQSGVVDADGGPCARCPSVQSETADDGSAVIGNRTIVVATVQGDIHDIGKNIVKMLLENYGFDVVDLGRDVSPEAILAAVRQTGARLVGLSALMTTTVPAMERTVKLLAQEAPDTAVMVGGAVVTPDYAQSIGARYYAKDAAASARIAKEFFAA